MPDTSIALLTDAAIVATSTAVAAVIPPNEPTNQPK
jgi:hypothetical protein